MSPLCVLALAAWAAAADAPPPADPKASALAAELAVAAGRYQEAAADSQAALLGGYETPALRLVRAQAFWHGARFDDALAEADRALILNPDSAQGHLWRARSLLALGRDAQGLDELRRASEMDRSLAGEYQAAKARLTPSPARRRLPYAAGTLALLGVGAAAALASRRKRGPRLVRFGALISARAAGDELPAGSVVEGRWVVGRLLERGAWGQRYEGRDLEDRPVALWRFAPAAGGARAFRAETARKAAALRHPGLVPLEAVFEQGAWGVAVGAADAAPALADALRARGGGLPAESLAAAAPVCEALEAAHAAGLSHGAITTTALRAGPEGWRLAGLGLPPAGAAAPEPPEGGAATPQADLYALAWALYEAHAGKPPFVSEAERRAGRPAPAGRRRSGAAAGLDAFFARALQADPARRFRTAGELRLALISAVSPAVH